MNRDVVITGLGLITPLGDESGEVLRRIEAGDLAVGAASSFDAEPFDCPYCAEIADFDPEEVLGENKTLRMMNRDAQLAVVAARRAIQDASITIGEDYPSHEAALFGSTGMAGMPMGEITRLVKGSAGRDGELDLKRFGAEALKRVRPVLSFKILANMPICFVSIFESLTGPNAVYTPWEGQGARAIAAGIMAIRSGRAKCALVGGCDTKAHTLGFISLQQHGVFESWRRSGAGTVPGEGAAFLVLEDERTARSRGAKIYARIAGWDVRTRNGSDTGDVLSGILASLGGCAPETVFAGCDGDDRDCESELQALTKARSASSRIVIPKKHTGNMFAAAAGLQLCLAAEACGSMRSGAVWANCSGHGSEMGSFALEAV